MHIVIISPSWPRQGAANGIVTYSDNMVVALRAQGHEVSVLARRRTCPDSDDSFIANDNCTFITDYQPTFFEKLIARIGEAISIGFSVYYIGGRSILAGIRRIEKKRTIDILEMEESFGWHYFLQPKVNFPIVMRLHGPHYVNGTLSDRPLNEWDSQRFKREERAFKSAQYVNSPCQWMLDEVQAKYNVRWPLQAVFFNPLPVLDKDDCWHSKSYTPKQILFVGRFDSHKGGDIVIQAFAKIIAKEPSATLLFVGPDPGVEHADGKMRIQEAIDNCLPKEQRSSLRYIGPSSGSLIQQLRRESHITVMASRNEILGYTVVESLASAAPIVAPYVGGVREVFDDGVSGVFFRGGDADDLAQKVMTLFDDTPTLEKIAAEGYKHCRQAFSLEKIGRQASNFYTLAVQQYEQE
ncbi:glycosyltransferase family 4 protein [Eionea flava]